MDSSQPIAELPKEWVEELTRSSQEPVSQPSVTEKVKKPGRNQFLSDKIFQLTKLGLSGEDLFNAGSVLNQKYCDPPITESRLRRICDGKKILKLMQL